MEINTIYYSDEDVEFPSTPTNRKKVSPSNVGSFAVSAGSANSGLTGRTLSFPSDCSIDYGPLCRIGMCNESKIQNVDKSELSSDRSRRDLTMLFGNELQSAFESESRSNDNNDSSNNSSDSQLTAITTSTEVRNKLEPLNAPSIAAELRAEDNESIVKQQVSPTKSLLSVSSTDSTVVAVVSSGRTGTRAAIHSKNNDNNNTTTDSNSPAFNRDCDDIAKDITSLLHHKSKAASTTNRFFPETSAPTSVDASTNSGSSSLLAKHQISKASFAERSSSDNRNKPAPFAFRRNISNEDLNSTINSNIYHLGNLRMGSNSYLLGECSVNEASEGEESSTISTLTNTSAASTSSASKGSIATANRHGSSIAPTSLTSTVAVVQSVGTTNSSSNNLLLSASKWNSSPQSTCSSVRSNPSTPTSTSAAAAAATGSKPGTPRYIGPRRQPPSQSPSHSPREHRQQRQQPLTPSPKIASPSPAPSQQFTPQSTSVFSFDKFDFVA